ncbi:MAG: MerR family transcriptional regulator [Bacteroidales bacterium]|nr:MerR family transcriptional regulator [Bacteroidales bacterium]
MQDQKLYYSISEAAALVGVAPSVLRFWENEFDALKPVRNRRGTRSYTARDLELLHRIHYLTRQCGYTLEGAREQLRQQPEADPRADVATRLMEVRQFLVDLKGML